MGIIDQCHRALSSGEAGLAYNFSASALRTGETCEAQSPREQTTIAYVGGRVISKSKDHLSS
jgi:hypothetical protein